MVGRGEVTCTLDSRCFTLHGPTLYPVGADLREGALFAATSFRWSVTARVRRKLLNRRILQLSARAGKCPRALRFVEGRSCKAGNNYSQTTCSGLHPSFCGAREHSIRLVEVGSLQRQRIFLEGPTGAHKLIQITKPPITYEFNWALAGVSGIPPVSSPHMTEKNHGDIPEVSVVVIGAGLSGLQAARTLSRTFPDLLIVEASEHIGGRVRQVDGIADWPVQLGPEFIHGAKSSLKRIIEEVGCRTREYEWPDYWYFGEERVLIKDCGEDEDLQRVHELFAAVGKLNPPRTDISAMQWLMQQGVSRRMIAIAEACYANDFGCSLDQLGLSEMIKENQRWDSGDTYLVLDRCLSSIVEHLQKDLEGRLRTRWPVCRVEHSSSGATLHGPSGQTLRARHVIITVPILVLQTQSIQFQPALPRDKLSAISRVRMSNAVKVILAFSEAFWPEAFFDVVCTDCFIPEFWVTSYASKGGSSTAVHCMTGFIAGKRAEDLSALRPSNIITNALNQLDQMFGCQQRPRPATGTFVRAHVADWSRVPWIGGAYSYPTLGARAGDRDALAAPVGDVLFFAGEATHDAVNPCMQAALETGERAAAQIMVARARSKL